MRSLMMTRLGVVLAGFMVAGSWAYAAQSACNLPLYHLCMESPTLDLSAECANNGGVLCQSCAAEQRIGTCAKRQGEHAIYLRYYQGITFDPVENCKQNGGVYSPGL